MRLLLTLFRYAVTVAVTATGAASAPLISKPYEPTGKFDGVAKRSSRSAMSPPFGGTVYVEDTIITAKDPTSLEAVAYGGTGTRYVYDRRSGWGRASVHLFNATFATTAVEFAVRDELNEPEARREVATYAQEFGRLPAVLLDGLDAVWIARGDEYWGGGRRRRRRGIPSHVLVHTGKAAHYRDLGIAVEVLVHEAVHAVLDRAVYKDPAWQAAVEQDDDYISTYARDYPTTEDAAETLLMWLGVEYRPDRLEIADYDKIVGAVPHRIAYFDAQGYDVTPLSASYAQADGAIAIRTSR